MCARGCAHVHVWAVVRYWLLIHFLGDAITSIMSLVAFFSLFKIAGAEIISFHIAVATIVGKVKPV